jgi:O-antigen/teichoic acid export membrane protein
LTAATSIFGPTLTTLLLGPDYTASGELLKILSINITFKSISLACISVLTAIGWNRTRLFAQLLSAIINVLLNLLIIRTFGLRGVAWVYVISECILMLGYLWLIPRARVFIRAAKQSV